MNEKTSNIARDDVELLQEAGPMMKRSDGKRASKWRGNQTVAVVRQDELSLCDLVRVKGVATLPVGKIWISEKQRRTEHRCIEILKAQNLKI